MPSGIEELAAHISRKNTATGARRQAPKARAPATPSGPDFAESVGHAVGTGVSKALAGWARSKKEQAAVEASRQKEVAALGQASIQAPIRGPQGPGPASAGVPGGNQFSPAAMGYMYGPYAPPGMVPMYMPQPMQMPMQQSMAPPAPPGPPPGMAPMPGPGPGPGPMGQ